MNRQSVQFILMVPRGGDEQANSIAMTLFACVLLFTESIVALFGLSVLISAVSTFNALTGHNVLVYVIAVLGLCAANALLLWLCIRTLFQSAAERIVCLEAFALSVSLLLSFPLAFFFALG